MGMIIAIAVSLSALFLALDPIGLLAGFNALKQEVPQKETRKTLISSLYLALAIVIGLLFGCRIISWFLGLSPEDFQIGAGIVLLVMAIHCLLNPTAKQKNNLEAGNVFSLPALLILSPVFIAMLLVLMNSYGLIITALSFAANMFFVYTIFKNADNLQAVLGDKGAALLSKTADVLLSVFAIMLIKKGVISLFIQIFAKNI